jgi:hypothetical protein
MRESSRSLRWIFGWVFVGIAGGLFCILFALANSEWVVFSLPAWPWREEVGWPVFETRLWAVMLVSAVLGGGLSGALLLLWRRVFSPRRDEESRRAALEREVERLNRLLAAKRDQGYSGPGERG